MAEPRNRVHLTAEVAAPPDQVFDYLTARFDELWQGGMEPLRDSENPDEPLGRGFVRRMHSPVGRLDEEIVTHERPRLIEYRVINGDVAPIHNHLGRLELSEAGPERTSLDYTVTFDHRPAWRGPLVAAAMRLGWIVRGRRRLARRLPG